MTTTNGSGWLSAAEAASRLGIRPETLYAYVSRGLLTPQREGRRSYFSIEALDRLEARGKRSSVRAGRLEVSIDSAVTLVDPAGHLYYRGVDVASIATTWSVERTAEWLWTGVDDGEPRLWRVAEAVDSYGATLPERLRSALAILSVTAPESDRRPAATPTIGRRVIPQLVAALPVLSEAPTSGVAPLVDQLWPRLSPLPATPERRAALTCALIVFADHELVPSTVAARMAASLECSPLDALLASMVSHSAVATRGFRVMIEEALRSGGEPPGAYEQVVYETRDPRADVLVPMVRAAASTVGWRRVEAALQDERPPSVDLAVAALSVACEMVPTAASAIYSLSRIVGVLAQIGEEYAHPSLFRPRSNYRGPVPEAPPPTRRDESG